MDTEELREDRAHDLLATAFEDDVPVVNLVPGAVEGYRRHRRRTRVLGAAGGALALTGAIVAGATVPSWGVPSGQTAAPAAGHSPAIAPAPVTAACHASAFYKFGNSVGVTWYLGDLNDLRAVCDRDVAALKAMVPGAKVTPRTETAKSAEQLHDISAGMPLPEVSADTPIVDTGSYVIEYAGHRVSATFDFSTKEIIFGDGCFSGACDPNARLAEDYPARAFSDTNGGGTVIVDLGGGHVANVRISDDGKDVTKFPFDFFAAIRTEAFFTAIRDDNRQLTRITHG